MMQATSVASPPGMISEKHAHSMLKTYYATKHIMHKLIMLPKKHTMQLFKTYFAKHTLQNILCNFVKTYYAKHIMSVC